MQLTTVPRVPIQRTGRFELASGPVDFAMEHLVSAVNAFENDPAVIAPRVRIELSDQGHLDGDGIATEASGGQGGPAVGWADNLTIAGNTLYADLHVPEVLAESMTWAFPSRSIEGIYNWTTATGQTHNFVATGLLLLGTSWPGVSTLPDFHEVQAEYAAAVAAGDVIAATFAQQNPEGILERSVVTASMPVTARAPKMLVQAGLSLPDLRMRWYAAEEKGDLAGLPDSYNFSSWYVTELRADDDGTIFALIIDEGAGQQWRFDVASISGSEVVWAEPYEVVTEIVRASSGQRPRIALASWPGRPESSPSTTSTEESSDMTDDQRIALAKALGLSETASETDIHAESVRRAAEGDPGPTAEEIAAQEAAAAVEVADAELVAASGRTVSVSAEVWEQTQRDAREGALARTAQVAAERDGIVSAAVADGRITPAERDDWRKDLDDAPEVTARTLARLTQKYPGGTAAAGLNGSSVKEGQSLAKARSAMGITRKQED